MRKHCMVCGRKLGRFEEARGICNSCLDKMVQRHFNNKKIRGEKDEDGYKIGRFGGQHNIKEIFDI